ncbi:hypothetical protein [Escherichia coli]|uniref:hypothetical protein n=1 Tax=Escherichia coli TaxID=562 RepID=UPI001FCEE3D9|nr:hypothetical protein [Escherichia coli]
MQDILLVCIRENQISWKRIHHKRLKIEIGTSGLFLCIFYVPALAGFVFPLYSGLQFARQPERLTPAAPAEKTDGAQNQISQF